MDPLGSISFDDGKWRKRIDWNFFLFLLLLFSLSNSSQQQKGRSGVYLVSPVFLLLFVFYQPFQKEMALATDITPVFSFLFHISRV